MSKTSVVRAAKRKRRQPPARVSGAKGGQSKPRQPYKAPDSALSISHANLLYFLSEGPIVGPVNGLESVKLDGTPMRGPDGGENFPGASWDFRPGTVDQDHIAGFPAIENEITQGFPVELRSDAPWTRAITDPQLSAVRIRLAWPQIWEVKGNGDQVGYRIDYVIELSVDGGSFQPYLNATLNDKGTTEYERSHRVDLPEGFTSALVRVRRLTANRNDVNWADTMRIKALTEVIDAKLRYPNLALGALRFDASQFQNIPKFSLRARGRIIRVPSNYDPETRAYTGNWNGTFKQAYTNNPAWIWYDLLLHRRYGLGRRITPDMVDKWTLYEIGRYCDVMVKDGLGGLEPRMTTNVYIQDQVEGYALLSDLASVFRGSSCWNGSMVTMVADIPGNEDGYVFTRSNIIGEFEYGAVAWPDRHTRVKVSYDNPANDFKTEPVPVTNEELIGILGHRQKDILAFGCTSQGQAMRHGVWLLKTEQHESWTVGFTTGMEGRNVEPGQIICIADELFSGRVSGGRIRAATKRVITLDLAAQIQPEDRLILNLPSGKTEGRIVKSVAGYEVTLLADYSELPQPESSWSVESADLAVMRFRVQTIEPHGLHQFEIKAVQHEPGKYYAIDNGARIDPQPISILPPGVMSPPENIQIEARSVVEQGLAVSTMRISWSASKGAVSYNVEWRKDNGTWVKLPSIGTLGAEVEGVYSGRYLARVSAINAMGVASPWGNSLEVQLQGKVGLPPAVTHLRTESLVYGIGINWGFPAGAEDTQRTELWQSTANNLADATKLGDFAYPQARHEMQNIVPGTSLFFWARLVDRTGNVGPWFPEKLGVNGQPSSDQTEYEKYFVGKIGKGALYQELRDDIELVTGDGPGSVKELAGKVQDLNTKVDGLVDTFVYDPALTYATGETTREGRYLYRALQDVPPDTPPPNPSYWKDIGELLETANGLVLQVNQNTTHIEEIDGKVAASASSLDALRAAARAEAGEGELADALKSWHSTADLAVEKRVRATDDEALSERITTFGAKVGENTAGLSTLEKVVATNESVSAKTITELKGQLVDVNAGISGNTQALETLSGEVSRIDGAVVASASNLESLRADARSDTGEGELSGALDAWSSTANFALEKKVRATAEEALAMKTEQLQVNLNQTTASVQQVSQAVVDVNGRVSAQTTIKAETIVDGRKVMAGLALGSDGETSEILAFAQRFAIIDEVTGQLRAPFIVSGGQVFINYAMIDTAFIQNLVLGMTLRSSAVNAKGLPLLEINIPAGMLTLRSAGAGGSSTLNNDGLVVTDEGDVVRTQVGKLTL
ncbi:phage tail protein [Pseudomonas bubulae]|uniref:phage tail protein n=1 Tax=Pseudomonas bubulae TaxID=2316085 RepID=UPI001F2F21F0|nr:phage tail protein [Pseudomonas bubulae]MCF3191444.1 phage tail protein [Pseudomonas bubulae]